MPPMSFPRVGSTVALVTSFVLMACTPPKAPTVPKPQEVVATEAHVEAPKVPRLEVSADTTPNLARVGKDQEIIVRVRVRGLPLVGKNRPPLNLALVVDTSGSMEGAAIEKSREACGTLLELLAEGDAVSVVTFGSRAKVIVPSVRITAETRAQAKAALKGLTAEGTTDMTAGLSEGITQIRAKLTPEGIHRIVLVGDGVPNDAPSVLALADAAKTMHVPITALGLGNDFDETLMTSLAQRSSGTFHFVDDASRVTAVFKEQISRMERLVARGARIDLTPGPGVTITEVIGQPESPAGRVHVASIGDLAEGQTRDVFVRLVAKGRQDGKNMELMDAQVSYTTPQGGPEMNASTFVKLAASTDEARLKDASIVEIEHAATTMRVADGIVKAMGLAREGDLTNARKVLEATLRLAKDGEKKFADKALGEKAVEMTKLRKTLPSLVPPDTADTKELPSASTPRVGKPMAPSPAEAMGMRAAHGDAMKALQGE